MMQDIKWKAHATRSHSRLPAHKPVGRQALRLRGAGAPAAGAASDHDEELSGLEVRCRPHIKCIADP